MRARACVRLRVRRCVRADAHVRACVRACVRLVQLSSTPQRRPKPSTASTQCTKYRVAAYCAPVAGTPDGCSRARARRSLRHTCRPDRSAHSRPPRGATSRRGGATTRPSGQAAHMPCDGAVRCGAELRSILIPSALGLARQSQRHRSYRRTESVAIRSVLNCVGSIHRTGGRAAATHFIILAEGPPSPSAECAIGIGANVGACVGARVGRGTGTRVGLAVGACVGASVGSAVGACVGGSVALPSTHTATHVHACLFAQTEIYRRRHEGSQAAVTSWHTIPL
jgi:hypothetical protein